MAGVVIEQVGDLDQVAGDLLDIGAGAASAFGHGFDGGPTNQASSANVLPWRELGAKFRREFIGE